ncbi:MAG TPA: ATP-binding protein [Candidatus Nanoarchaeia archaeon]|nr:adaptive-response sensory-kinase SasA [uncultured archaeon]
MRLDLILAVSIIVANLLLGLLVITRNPKNWTNRLFAALSLLMAFWSFVSFSEDETFGRSVINLLKSLDYASASLIAYVFLLFSLNFPKAKLHVKRDLLLFIPTLLLIVLSFTDLIAYVEIVGNRVKFTYGPLGDLFSVYSFLYVVLISAVALFIKFKTLVGVEKSQTFYVLLGLISTSVIAVLTNVVLPQLINVTPAITRLGIYGFVLFLGATAYAIVRHRLLDIRLVVARTVAYSLLVFSIAIFYIGSTVLLTNFLFRTTTSTAQLLIYASLTLVVAFTFQPLRRFFEHVTDRIFFKEDYESTVLLSDLTRTMAETILIDDIAHKLLEKILAQMRITRGAFVLTDAGKIFVSETSGYKKEPSFSEKDVFSLEAIDKNLVFEDLEEGATKELLRRLDVTVVIPLKTQIDHVGVLLLGEKASGEIYSSKDIKVLEIFSPEAAISFENAKSVEKIRRFNITLKEQVERATRELKKANEALKEIDKLKDEFLSIASHDLRTPMTAIKSYLWMALNGRAGEIKNEKLKHYLDVSYTSSERMIALINDLLNVSRIEAGRVQLNFEEAALKPLVDQVFAEIASKTDEKKIVLTYEEQPKLPKVILDKQRFPEILQNLVGNAIKFTPEKGKITVKSSLSQEAGFVEISVTDTGVGMTKEGIDKLFTKYGRLENSYAAAATSGGTGLGLYITKNYVELLGGKIWVKSEVGKGSSFIFTLRIAERSVLDEMRQESEKKNFAASVPKI